MTDPLVLRIYRRLRRLAFCFRHMHGSQKIAVIADEILGRERERSLTVAGIPITLRSSSADLFVVDACFVKHEYADIELSNPGFIVDAGANIGTSAINFTRRFPEARILAIEAERGNYELLRKNTAAYENITPLHAALWPTTGQRRVMARPKGHWSYTVSQTTDEATDTGQAVECVSIASVLETFGQHHIDLLKLDIEGGERDLFEAPTDWLAQVSVLAVELHDRVAPGSSRAFYLATTDFASFDIQGEKVVAYRQAVTT